jgi:hypothetical protein
LSEAQELPKITVKGVEKDGVTKFITVYKGKQIGNAFKTRAAAQAVADRDNAFLVQRSNPKVSEIMNKAQELAKLAEENTLDDFKVGDLCSHDTLGSCKVTMLDKARGLVQIRYPENSTGSQAFWALVEPKTLKKAK